MRRKKFMVLLLTMVFIIGSIPAPAWGATVMTLDEARQMGIDNSAGVKDVVIDRIQKEIELQQAKEGIQDIRKKESTVRFSLLFNIQLPEKHGMPKEIELIMKVPEVQSEITVLKKQEPYERLKSQKKVEEAYYDVMLADSNVNYLEERIADSKQVLQRLETTFKLGKGKKDDVDYMKNQVIDFEGEYQKALLEQDMKRKTLASLLGIDVRTGYEFQEYFPEINLTRSQLEDIINYAKENDFELFKKTEARRLAEVDTSEILGIYQNKYAKYIGNVESYIYSHEPDEMDYEEFIKLYNEALTQIDSPWDGAYVIDLIFFKIRIPKEWFKGEYSGTRYMEDQKYALFLSLVEREKAVKAEQKAIQDLEDSVYSNYNNLKQMESAYENAKLSLEMAEKSYEEKQIQNKMGLVEFTSLESSRNDFYSKQRSLYEMRIEYAKSLSSFNLLTAGYVNHLLGETSIDATTLTAGDSFVEKAQWYVDTSLTSQTFSFGVRLPEEYDADQYQLMYQNQKIGEKTAIDDKIIHMPFVYQDTTLIEVMFYKNGQHTYTGYFDGGQYEGELEMKKVNEKSTVSETTERDILGQWNIAIVDNMRKSFSLTIQNNVEYASYELMYDTSSIGKAQKGESIVTLGLYFSNMENMSVVFYDEKGNVVTRGALQNGVDHGNIKVQ